MISHTPEDSKRKTILDSIVVVDPVSDLAQVARTEARVFLLYSTKKEASSILEAAKGHGLTGRSYVWIATQAVIGPTLAAPSEFPVGMLGKKAYLYVGSNQ